MDDIGDALDVVEVLGILDVVGFIPPGCELIPEGVLGRRRRGGEPIRLRPGRIVPAPSGVQQLSPDAGVDSTR